MRIHPLMSLVSMFAMVACAPTPEATSVDDEVTGGETLLPGPAVEAALLDWPELLDGESEEPSLRFEGTFTMRSEADARNLAHFDVVTGDLVIQGWETSSLEGWVGDLTVFGSVVIEDNNLLRDLRGLEGLRDVRGLVISGNERLIDLDGLGTPRADLRKLIVTSNESLASLEALTGVEHIEEVMIGYNDSLRDLYGLHDVSKMVTLELVRLPLRDLSGLASLENIVDNFRLIETDVESMAGLSRLETVYSATIRTNPWLESLDGLDALYEVTNYLAVEDNPSLVDVDALWAVESSPTLSVASNPLLCQSDVDGLVSELESPAGSVAGNADGC